MEEGEGWRNSDNGETENIYSLGSRLWGSCQGTIQSEILMVGVWRGRGGRQAKPLIDGETHMDPSFALLPSL